MLTCIVKVCEDLYMLNTQAIATVADYLAPMHADPAFEGATVNKITRSHPDFDDYDPADIVGVHVVFRNGMTLSIQWGRSGNYSNIARGNWHPGCGYEPEFETAAWYPAEGDERKGAWYLPEIDGPSPESYEDRMALGVYDDVQPYQTVAQVMDTARKVANHEPPNALRNLGRALALVASL